MEEAFKKVAQQHNHHLFGVTKMADFDGGDHRRVGRDAREHRDHGGDGKYLRMRQIPARPLNADAADQQTRRERWPILC